MKPFISADWGTSVLRIRVIDADTKSVIAELSNPIGIASAFGLWQQSGMPERERLYFYQQILDKQAEKLKEKINFNTHDLPMIISGMASSSIGMKNLPYKEIPFSTDGCDLNVEIFKATSDCNHSTMIISGAKTNEDVMRGEETQLIGSIDALDKKTTLFIFPGTHSKHVNVKSGKVIDVKTYMTGELFDLLSKKSILLNSVQQNNDLAVAGNLKSFEKGIDDSLYLNFLNSSFRVRTNDLFHKISKKENYCYLSGLLIGTELKELPPDISCTITGEKLINKFYKAALHKLHFKKAKFIESGDAIIRGHCLFFNLYKTKLLLS